VNKEEREEEVARILLEPVNFNNCKGEKWTEKGSNIIEDLKFIKKEIENRRLKTIKKILEAISGEEIPEIKSEHKFLFHKKYEEAFTSSHAFIHFRDCIIFTDYVDEKSFIIFDKNPHEKKPTPINIPKPFSKIIGGP
jgi:hypothetical protein